MVSGTESDAHHIVWAKKMVQNDTERHELCDREFAAADADGSGDLDVNEVVDLVFKICTEMAIKLPKKEKIVELVKVCDKSGDGDLQQNEFRTAFKTILKSAIHEAEKEDIEAAAAKKAAEEQQAAEEAAAAAKAAADAAATAAAEKLAAEEAAAAKAAAEAAAKVAEEAAVAKAAAEAAAKVAEEAAVDKAAAEAVAKVAEEAAVAKAAAEAAAKVAEEAAVAKAAAEAAAKVAEEAAVAKAAAEAAAKVAEEAAAAKAAADAAAKKSFEQQRAANQATAGASGTDAHHIVWAKRMLQNDAELHDLCDREFAAADKDSNGSLDVNEVVELVFKICLEMSIKLPKKEKIAELVKVCDKSKDGALQMNEFRTAFKAVLKSCIHEAEKEDAEAAAAKAAAPKATGDNPSVATVMKSWTPSAIKVYTDTLSKFDTNLQMAEKSIKFLKGTDNAHSIRAKTFRTELFGALPKLSEALDLLNKGEKGSHDYMAAAFAEPSDRLPRLKVVLSADAEFEAEPSSFCARSLLKNDPEIANNHMHEKSMEHLICSVKAASGVVTEHVRRRSSLQLPAAGYPA